MFAHHAWIKSMSFYEDNRTAQAAFYKTKKWKKCRAAYLSEHPCCERCEKAGLISIAVHVHHKKELTEDNYLDPNIALNPDNLEALCFACHQKEHHGKQEVGENLYFDADGNLIQDIGGL